MGGWKFRKLGKFGKMSGDTYTWNQARDELNQDRQTRSSKIIDQAVSIEDWPQPRPVSNLTLYGLVVAPAIVVIYNKDRYSQQSTKGEAVQVLFESTPMEGGDGVRCIKHLEGGPPAAFEVKGLKLYPKSRNPIHGRILYYLGEEPEKTTTRGRKLLEKGKTKSRIYRVESHNIKAWEPVRKRHPTQVKLMGSPAAKAVREAGVSLYRERMWHWCHLIAHSMGDHNRPQDPDNLVAGSAACNGDMALLESVIKVLIKEKKVMNGLSLQVTADLVKDTAHVAMQINYKVTNDENGASSVFSFDALDVNRSPIHLADIYAAKLADDLKLPCDESQRADLIKELTGERHRRIPSPLRDDGAPMHSPLPLVDTWFPQTHSSQPNTPVNSPTTSAPLQSSSKSDQREPQVAKEGWRMSVKVKKFKFFE
ncbi:MAG TPA: hypothetical protein VFS43_37005 [Polyangiaceae bacterium]|nr:hypothetical protein [Polyangiaceae bacterium]